MLSADDETPRGPRAMAEFIETHIRELDGKLEAVVDPKEAKRLRKVRKLNRDLLRWCKTRAGY